MTEQWKPILGYETCYVVSDLGNVARILTYGKRPRTVWKLLAKRVKPNGYLTYHLCKDGRRFDAKAHRLVWEAFKGPIPVGLEINHKNSARSDPRLCNLELMTRSQNAAYAFSHNGRPAPNNPSPGSRNGCAKLTETDIPVIRKLAASGMTQKEIGSWFGVSQPAIGMILRGEKWRHV